MRSDKPYAMSDEIAAIVAEHGLEGALQRHPGLVVIDPGEDYPYRIVWG